MVMLLSARDCVCGVCNGGDKAPKDVYGGSHCPCQCHNKQAIASSIEGQVSLNAILLYEKEIKQRDERIKEQAKEIKFLYDNSKSQVFLMKSNAEKDGEISRLEQELDAVKRGNTELLEELKGEHEACVNNEMGEYSFKHNNKPCETCLIISKHQGKP